MSRSYKKFPGGGISCCESSKDWKNNNHRRFRKKDKDQLKEIMKMSGYGDYEDLEPELFAEIQVANSWTDPKDGSTVYFEEGYKGTKKFKKNPGNHAKELFNDKLYQLYMK